MDELNNILKPYNLFFAPETSTSNRCTIGGMVGNNSCGSHSLVYGSTRDHLLEVKVILANTKEAVFKTLSKEEFEEKTLAPNLEGDIYKHLKERYSDNDIQRKIVDAFPEKQIRRRNNGYALDEIFDNNVFNPQSNNEFNLSKLFAASEGTLGFGVEFKLNLMPLAPKNKALICAHFASLEDSFDGNLIALEHSPMAIELMDNNILTSAKRNIEQRKNMFFVEGNPQAILIIELAQESEEELLKKTDRIIEALKKANKGYAFSVVRGKDMAKVWALRKAGLGLLTNIPGLSLIHI